MRVGDAVRVTMEFGKYFHKGVDVAGMYGIILDLIDHDFYLFRDQESNELQVIYKRNHGGYGVIQARD